MASAFFLYGQFEEVLVYLNSIRSYFVNDDTFNYNYGQVSGGKIAELSEKLKNLIEQAKAATGYYKEAEELLVQISDLDIRHQPTYEMVLARCHINSGHADHVCKIGVHLLQFFVI